MDTTPEENKTQTNELEYNEDTNTPTPFPVILISGSANYYKITLPDVINISNIKT